MIKVFTHFGQLCSTEKFKPWLLHIALNEALLKHAAGGTISMSSLNPTKSLATFSCARILLTGGRSLRRRSGQGDSPDRESGPAGIASLGKGRSSCLET